MAFNIGDSVGDYQIAGILGAGGMGKVYKVRNVISDRVEAMKVLLPDLANESELADRFIREIKLLASLNHPNIAALHTAMRLDNQLVMIMEFVEGRTLEDRMREGPVAAIEGIECMIQVLSALAYAHERGVVHRDIKPANMMLTPAGEVKLMDFGIAKAVADRRLTMTGTTLGSLYYMSPEQVKGSVNLDGRSDLYSVGVSLYEVITGVRPFRGDSDYSIMVAHLEQNPKPPIELDPKVPPMLNEVIMTAIAKDPGERFQTAEAFRNALESVRQSLGAAAPVAAQAAPKPQQPQIQPKPQSQAAPVAPPPAAVQQQKSGHRGLWMALGALVVLAIIAVAAIQLPRWYKARAGSTEQAEAPAQQPAVPAAEPPVQAAAESAPAPSATTAAATAAPAEPAPVIRPQAASVKQPPAVPPRPRPAAQSSFETASPAQAPAQVQAQQSPPVQQQPAGPDPEVVQQLRDRMINLGSRANAARSSLQNLEQQQKSQGLSLRTDISAARMRMEALLDDAEANLKNGNVTQAKRSMDQAEAALDKIESFLGR
jgi:Tfp pilus assembly protein PilX